MSNEIAVPGQTQKASLGQNIPNPFNGSTLISYYLPSNSTAKLTVSDLSGKVVKEYNLTEEGFGQVSFDHIGLASGTYSYALFVDGKLVDSKKMNLVK